MQVLIRARCVSPCLHGCVVGGVVGGVEPMQALVRCTWVCPWPHGVVGPVTHWLVSGLCVWFWPHCGIFTQMLVRGRWSSPWPHGCAGGVVGGGVVPMQVLVRVTCVSPCLQTDRQLLVRDT
jgi:hypothetical protein